jgi:cobalt-zinc-cadmium efflux system protein
VKTDEEDHKHESSDNLKIAFFLNFGFTIIEILGGFWTNSIAILTDAIHDSGDSLSLGLAWYFDTLSRRGRTPKHTYGYRRYRLLGGLITGLVLMIGLGFVLYHAIGRLANPQPVRISGMLLLAVFGIFFNGIAVLRMSKGRSLTEKLVNWHLIEDTLGWVGVLIGAAVIAIWNLPIVDPILSIAISLIVLWNVIRNLSKVFSVILQKAPENFDAGEFEKQVSQFEGIESLHHVHCWTIDGESHVLSAHLVIDDTVQDIPKLKARVRSLLDLESFEHVTLETERAHEDCPQK